MSGGGGGRGGLVQTNFQLLLLSPNLLEFQILMSGGEGGLVETNFQLLLLSPNLLKSKIPISGGWGGWWNQFPTFDTESKFAEKKFFPGKNVPENGFGL